MPDSFRVGLTNDFLKPDGSLIFDDLGLDLLDQAAGLGREFLAEATPELSADQVRPFDALLVLGGRVTEQTLAGADRLAIVARSGVGYDSVDVGACTRAGVVVTITPDGVRRPVASSVVAFMLALSLRMLDKDRLTRQGRWAEKTSYNGLGLAGRTLGVIGMGNIGREIVDLSRSFGLRYLAFDPFLSSAHAAAAGVELVDLETLLRTADFVSVNCPLDAETYHLLDARRLGWMRPSAYLINTARGPIVDQVALTTALAERRLAGAALDVFEQEPIDAEDPLLRLDNVIVAPHAICWTDECFRDNGRSACRSILDVAAGRAPTYVVNREVLDTSRFRARLERYAARHASA